MKISNKKEPQQNVINHLPDTDFILYEDLQKSIAEPYSSLINDTTLQSNGSITIYFDLEEIF